MISMQKICESWLQWNFRTRYSLWVIAIQLSTQTAAIRPQICSFPQIMLLLQHIAILLQRWQPHTMSMVLIRVIRLVLVTLRMTAAEALFVYLEICAAAQTHVMTLHAPVIAATAAEPIALVHAPTMTDAEVVLCVSEASAAVVMLATTNHALVTIATAAERIAGVDAPAMTTVVEALFVWVELAVVATFATILFATRITTMIAVAETAVAVAAVAVAATAAPVRGTAATCGVDYQISLK
jgi:hypothetical protein